MSHDVFISHSTAGRLTAYAICSELEALGIRCWILPRDLKSGTGWDQSIANAITSCRVMIVVFSEYGNRSERVERQLELAFNRGVIVIPFRTDSDLIGSDLPPPEPAHWIDALTPETTKRLGELCDLVRSLIVGEKNELRPSKASAMGQEKTLSTDVESITEV